MIRCLIVLLLWLATLGIADIKAEWADGWKIELHGWLAAIVRKAHRFRDAKLRLPDMPPAPKAGEEGRRG